MTASDVRGLHQQMSWAEIAALSRASVSGMAMPTYSLVFFNMMFRSSQKRDTPK
jgi:hypothetical protein